MGKKELWEPDLDVKKLLFQYLDMLWGDREQDPDVMRKGKLYSAKLGAKRWTKLTDQYKEYKNLKNPVDYVHLLKEDLGEPKSKQRSEELPGIKF
jgi:hypothetical protein